MPGEGLAQFSRYYRAQPVGTGAKFQGREIATKARGIAKMIKLGKVSSRTKGPIVIGMAEDVGRKFPGFYYPVF